MYYNHFKNGHWGLDQSSLINLFVRDQNWTSQRFLDSPISTTYHKVGGPLIKCQSINVDIYRKEINLDIDKEIVDLIDSETKWAGEPTNLRGGKLTKLFEVQNENIQRMKLVIDSCSDEIKNFYLGDV